MRSVLSIDHFGKEEVAECRRKRKHGVFRDGRAKTWY